jgi:hypothetical protein
VTAPETARYGDRSWRGVVWLRPVNGVCPYHCVLVGAVTRLCILCHREQLVAARRGSSEWQRPATAGQGGS